MAGTRYRRPGGSRLQPGGAAQAVRDGRDAARGCGARWPGRFTSVWLVYLIEPVSGLFGHDHDALYISGGLAIIAAFCVVFVVTLADWNATPALRATWLATLFALALAACVLYGGSGATSLWIYVSAISGLLSPAAHRPGGAARLTGVCYTVSCFTGHVDMGDFLINLLPTVLLGLAMIGLRKHFELTRELSQARETWPARRQPGAAAAGAGHARPDRAVALDDHAQVRARPAAARPAAGRPRPGPRPRRDRAGRRRSAGRPCTTSGRRSAATGGRRWRWRSSPPAPPSRRPGSRRRTTPISPCCRARSTRTPRPRWPGACARR